MMFSCSRLLTLIMTTFFYCGNASQRVHSAQMWLKHACVVLVAKATSHCVTEVIIVQAAIS